MLGKSVAYVLLIALAGALCAQTPTGSVSGNAADISGAQIAGATIRLIDTQTHQTRTATTNATGAYIFPIVPVGVYALEAESPGFKLDKRAGVTLDVNQNARVDFVLQVGSVQEVVEVTGDAPLVDTMDVQIGDTVDEQRIDNLPLQGRNIYDLIALAPGAVNVTTGVSGSNDSNQMSVNGNNIRSNSFYIEGGSNTSQWRNGGNQAPNPDAIAEFHLITSNFDAEYGRQAGSVLNVALRSGTNAYHGSLFEFLRNDTVNAKNYFRTTSPTLRWNQFGGTLGGPIKHDRTFFFFSYQGFRESTTQAKNSVLVPTLAQRSGDFTAQKPKDPLTGVAFPGGIIPVTRLDPVAMKIINTMFPLPNNAAGTNYSIAEPAPVSENQATVKIDHQLTAANHISGTLFINRSNTVLPFGNSSNSEIPNWSTSHSVYRQNNIIVNDTMMIAPNLISEARFSYVLNYYGTTCLIPTSWADWGSKIVLGATPPRPPLLVITNGLTAGPGGGANDIMPQSTWGGTDRITWTKGAHNIRAGVSYFWNHFLETGNWLGAGQVRFTGASTGNGEADFQLGLANTFRQNNGLNRNFQQSNEAAFIQDNWRVLPKLTLQLGLRWELNPPYTSAGGQLGGFQFGTESTIYPTSPRGMLFPGDPGVPAGIAPTNYTNFGPRIGFAWDPFGNGKTAIRGGYGVFYSVGMVNLISNLQNQPFIVDITLNATKNLVDPWADFGGTPYPYTPNAKNPIFVTPVSQNYAGDNFGSPYVQQYNFTIQRQLFRSMSLQVGYVGNNSRKLLIQRDSNAAIWSPGATASNVASRRPYMPNVFGGIFEDETAQSANYNSLQVSFNRRFANNFTFSANYVWSKAIDINDDQATSISAVNVSDSYNLRRDIGPATFNYPQVFKMSWVYQSPRIHFLGFVGRQALSGWQLSGIMTDRTGHSMNVLSGTDSNVDGNAQDRPYVVGDPSMPSGRSRAQQKAEFFNIAAFAKVPAGVLYGNAGRNVLRGPNSVTWNAAAMKDFQIAEHKRLQFRTDFYNALNDVNFNDPNATVGNANMGKLTSAAAARQLQFCLKLYF